MKLFSALFASAAVVAGFAAESQAMPIVMTFDAPSGGNLNSLFYQEAGFEWESQYPPLGSGHLHNGPGVVGNGLFNHSGCCSEPYELTQIGGGAFTLSSLVVTQDFSGGTAYLMAIGGPNNGMTFALNMGTGLYNFGAFFTNVTAVRWFQPNGDMTIDNVTLNAQAVPEPTSLALWGIGGVIGLAIAKRRRGKALAV